MPVTRFPDPRNPENSTPDGILALGGDLRPETLLAAYRQGIFPWPIEGIPLAWFCPPERAILEKNRLHVPRSLEKASRKSSLRFTFDEAFPEVIRTCAKTRRPGQKGTWITPEMLKAYCEMHRLGYAHSVEAWLPVKTGEKQGEKLVGGLYGIEVGGAFSAESMFYREPGASKLALLHLVDHLAGQGLDWIDIQVMTPHLKALGAREISRDEYLLKLAETQREASRLNRLHRFALRPAGPSV